MGVEKIIPVWEKLKTEKRPIWLYGMGDGAQKILNKFETEGIKASGVFASDNFVRGHSFAGFQVHTLSQVQEKCNDIVIILAFASQLAEILDRFYYLAETYPVYAPDLPIAGDTLFDWEFAKQNQEKLTAAWNLMADEQSRFVFEQVVLYKLDGDIRRLKNCESSKKEAFQTVLKPQKDEIFLDLGAYDGDTIREVLAYTDGAYQNIIAWEPNLKNFRKLKTFSKDMERIELFHLGAWDKKDVLPFSSGAGRNAALHGKGRTVKVEVDAVDHILMGQKATMIKMDIEGAEMRALSGAADTIMRWKPRLNIAAYHRSEDLFELPLYLHTLCPEYAFYLRHHPYVPAWDTNLYVTT